MSRIRIDLLAAAGLVLAALGQEPAQTPPIRVTAEEVVLDVVVRDKKGKPIQDLTAADVTVTDNGVRRDIASFRLVQGREAIENGNKVSLDALRQVRLVSLVFSPMDADARRTARQAALDLIKGDQARNVFYAVFQLENQLYPLQEFTTDREKLRAAITTATSGQLTQMAQVSERVRQNLSQTAGSAPALPPPVSPGADLGAQAVAQRLALVMSEIVRFDTAVVQSEYSRLTVAALGALARSQMSMPGRKNILFFTQGLMIPPHLDEPFRNVMSLANRGNVTFYAIDAGGVNFASEAGEANRQLQQALQARHEEGEDGRLNAANILSADAIELSMRNNVRLKLQELAENTGGFMIANRNDLREPLQQINEEINSFYEIAYNPAIETYDGQFRETRVAVSRKDAVVHARNGYFALPPDARGMSVLPYEFTLMRALQANPLPRSMEFRAAGLRFGPVANGVRGTVVVEVPLGQIAFTQAPGATTYKARVSVLVLLKDQQGEVKAKFSRDLPLAGPVTQIPQVKAGNFIYQEQFEVPAGRYTLETAAMDHEAQKFGARKTVMVIPARRPGVALSSVSLVRNYQAAARNLSPQDPLQFQGGRVTPSLGGTVRAAKGAQLAVFFVVYPDASIAEAPRLRVEYLLDGKLAGKADVELPKADASGAIPYVMSSPAENLPPGNYEVRVVAAQGASATEERTLVTIEAAQ